MILKLLQQWNLLMLNMPKKLNFVSGFIKQIEAIDKVEEAQEVSK